MTWRGVDPINARKWQAGSPLPFMANHAICGWKFQKFSEKCDDLVSMQADISQVQEDTPTFGKLIGVLILILSLRLFSLAYNNSELFFDEAQYWAWAQQLEFGYFSKPPFLAWTIHFFTSVCGNDGEFCVRLASPIFHTGTCLVIFVLGRSLFNSRIAFWSAITFAFLPAVSLSSTIISTDVPLLFFWSLALLAYVRLIKEEGFLWAVILGFALGLGMLSKYAMAYFFLCAIIFAIVSPQGRSVWKSAKIWVAFVVGALIFSGNIIWNIDNQFATVSHTGDNISWSGLNFNVGKLLEFFGSQFGVFGPILMGVFCIALVRNRLFRGSDAQKLLVCFSFPILAIILFQALMSKAYANWAALTYVGATIYTIEVMIREVPKVWLRSSTLLHVAVFTVLSLAVTRAGPGELVLPGGTEPFQRTQGSDEMADIVVHALEEGNYQTVITTDRRTSSLMTYKLRGRVEKVRAWRRTDTPNDYFEQSRAFQDSPTDRALIVQAKRGIKDLESVFETVEKLGKYSLQSGEQNEITLISVTGYKHN